MADKQPLNSQAMRMLIPPLSTTAYTTNTSKQKKTNEEKRSKKKELDQTMLRGLALEASQSAVEREGEGPGSCTRSNFQVHSLLSSTNVSFSRILIKSQVWHLTHILYYLKVIFTTFRTSRWHTWPQYLRPKQMGANGHTSFKLERSIIKLTKTINK